VQDTPYDQSVEVKVTEEDVPAIRSWLSERAATMWEPFLG
jgi:hypothetical protein